MFSKTLLTGFLWLLYAQLALAAGPSHYFEIVLEFITYRLQWRMYGSAQKFMFPVTPDMGPSVPENAGPDGKGLPFKVFAAKYIDPINWRTLNIDVEFDIDNPVRTAELLSAGGFNGVLRVPDVKGLDFKYKNKAAETNDNEVPPKLKDYNLFTEEMTQTFDDASKTYSTGPDSVVFKELSAFEPLVAKIRESRFNDMLEERNLVKSIAGAFTSLKPKQVKFKDRIELFSDPEVWRAIKEGFNMQDLKDDDPKIGAAMYSWLEGIGTARAPGLGPAYTKAVLAHLFVLDGWRGMEDHIRCQRRKYLT